LAYQRYFVDPSDLDAYLFAGNTGSPYFRSVSFPLLLNLDAVFRLETFSNGQWNQLGLFDELASYDFGVDGADQFRFFVLDSHSMLPPTSIEPFAFGVTFTSDGFFDGTLTEYSTRVSVPEPATLLLIFIGLVGLGWSRVCHWRCAASGVHQAHAQRWRRSGGQEPAHQGRVQPHAERAEATRR
jgi:hypothetical protein